VDGSRFRIWRRLVTAALLLMTSGCASLRLPAIDPSGQNILLPTPNFTTLASHPTDPVTGEKQHPLLGHLHNKRPPAFASPPAVPDCNLPSAGPNQITEAPPEIPADPVAPRVLVPGACEDPMSAAENANSGLLGHARTPSNPQAVVTLSPRRQIAAVGSEMVLLGGVCGGDGYYRMREPLEWVLSTGSVGHFVDPGQAFVGRLGLRGRMSGLFAEPLPELVSNNYAVSCTSKKVQVLTRGTVQTNDDIIVESGQAWIGVTSPVEGDTYVTLMAPDLDGWEQRKQTAIIHWVDGQWSLPPSTVIQGIQPHTLTTKVVRRLTSSPVMGWIVRYRILDATATFAEGGMERDVTTDSNGEASIQIVPALAAGGMARVQVQVIHPPRGTAEQLLVGDGTTSVSWTNSQLNVRISGPETVELNQQATYQIEVTNPGSLAAQAITVQSLVPAGFELVGTAPTAQAFGSRLDWVLDQLGPGQRQVFEVTFRAVQSGTIRHCANAKTANGMAVEDCLTTQVTIDALSIEMSGPNPDIPLPVGQEIEYTATIENRGDVRLTDIILSDRFDPGLEHSRGLSPLEWNDFGALEPGQKRQVSLKFRLVQTGRQCHTLEATASGTPPARVSACVTGQEAARASLTVRKTAPNEMTEGESADFYVIVENTGDAELTNLQVIDQYDNEFEPIAADPPDHVAQQGRIIWYVTRLAAGEKRTFQVRCRAVIGNVSSACSEVLVRTADGLEQSDRRCIPVLPAAGGAGRPTGSSSRGAAGPAPGATPLPGTTPDADRLGGTNASPISQDRGELELTIDARGDRWRVGDVIEYLVVIRNNRSVADNDVVLTVELPPQLKLKNYAGSVRAPPGTTNWQLFRLTPIQTLRPGESTQFQVWAEVVRAGQIATRVEVRSFRTPNGILREDVSIAGT